jgi:hypothetical protein
MIAEIAAANAAFNVIKAALANGKELSALGSKVFDYFDNKAAIQEQANKKGGGSDLAEFMALEQLKQQYALPVQFLQVAHCHVPLPAHHIPFQSFN